MRFEGAGLERRERRVEQQPHAMHSHGIGGCTKGRAVEIAAVAAMSAFSFLLRKENALLAESKQQQLPFHKLIVYRRGLELLGAVKAARIRDPRLSDQAERAASRFASTSRRLRGRGLDFNLVQAASTSRLHVHVFLATACESCAAAPCARSVAIDASSSSTTTSA